MDKSNNRLIGKDDNGTIYDLLNNRVVTGIQVLERFNIKKSSFNPIIVKLERGYAIFDMVDYSWIRNIYYTQDASGQEHKIVTVYSPGEKTVAVTMLSLLSQNRRNLLSSALSAYKRSLSLYRSPSGLGLSYLATDERFYDAITGNRVIQNETRERLSIYYPEGAIVYLQSENNRDAKLVVYSRNQLIDRKLVPGYHIDDIIELGVPEWDRPITDKLHLHFSVPKRTLSPLMSPIKQGIEHASTMGIPSGLPNFTPYESSPVRSPTRSPPKYSTPLSPERVLSPTSQFNVIQGSPLEERLSPMSDISTPPQALSPLSPSSPIYSTTSHVTPLRLSQNREQLPKIPHYNPDVVGESLTRLNAYLYNISQSEPKYPLESLDAINELSKYGKIVKFEFKPLLQPLAGPPGSRNRVITFTDSDGKEHSAIAYYDIATNTVKRPQ
jgi:hypothetical protein